MNIGVEFFKELNHRTICDVVDKTTSLPHCFYLSTFLRERCRTYAKMEVTAYAIKYWLDYAIPKEIDIVERVRSGQLLTRSESDDYITHCHFRSNSHSYRTRRNVVDFSEFSDRNIEHLIDATKHSRNHVQDATIKQRLIYFHQYVAYLFEIIHYGNAKSELRDAYADFSSFIKTHTKRLSGANTTLAEDPFESAIPDKVYFRLLDIIQPSHDENPFSKNVQFRNQLIIQILNETSIRIGALSKLKISDLRDDADTPRFHVTKTTNDPTDTRTRPAAQKTKAHISSLSKPTFKHLLEYIKTVRSDIHHTDEHDFVFVSHKGPTKGQPLAISSIKDAIDKVSKTLNFNLHAHKFRHKWQEIFEVKAKAAGYTTQQINDMRKQACGWSENSTMIHRYNQFMHAINVAKLSKIRQSEFVPQLDES